MTCRLDHHAAAERYRTEQMPPEEEAAYEEHLFDCERCRNALQRLRIASDIALDRPRKGNELLRGALACAVTGVAVYGSAAWRPAALGVGPALGILACAVIGLLWTRKLHVSYAFVVYLLGSAWVSTLALGPDGASITSWILSLPVLLEFAFRYQTKAWVKWGVTAAIVLCVAAIVGGFYTTVGYRGLVAPLYRHTGWNAVLASRALQMVSVIGVALGLAYVLRRDASEAAELRTAILVGLALRAVVIAAPDLMSYSSPRWDRTTSTVAMLRQWAAAAHIAALAVWTYFVWAREFASVPAERIQRAWTLWQARHRPA